MKKKCLIGGLFLFFLGILILVLTGHIKPFDDWIYNQLTSFRNPFWDQFFKGITRFGNTSTVIIFCCILFFYLSKKDRWIYLTTIISTVGINQILKHIIRRPRPSHIRLIEELGYSFPSGHAMISIALYGFLIYYVYKKVHNKALKIGLICLFSFIILGIGCSRIYVGVHYPSDVLGGYFLALTNLLIVFTYFNSRGDIHD